MRPRHDPRLTMILPPLAVALALRLLLWGNIPRVGLISDEGEYLSAAQWLADGRGFDWYQGYLWTRAPLYPLFVASHLRLFGPGLTPIYIAQTLLSLLIVGLVFALGRSLAPQSRAVAPLAALLAGLYLPFALYSQVLLSETLFITLVLGALLALASWPITVRRAAAAGLLLGLATLTRSLTLGFLPLVALWLLYQSRRQVDCHKPQAASGNRQLVIFVLAATLTILPWSIYNSRVYGGPVLVDTSGAFNLLLGARTAYDGKRSDAETRDFVLGLLGQPIAAPIGPTCAPYPGALATQFARQAAMTREGLCLVAARPDAFARKSLAELIDLFQINYTGAERFTDGFSTGRLDPAYLLTLFLLDDTIYVLTLPLAVIGWGLTRALPRPPPLVVLTGMWWVYNLAVAPLLFAINRFRLPLMPLVFVFAAWTIVALTRNARISWPVEQARQRIVPITGALALLLLLVAATPYAYLEPRLPDADSRWASYLGPYPSSLDITLKALAARPRYENDQRFKQALKAGDLRTAAAILSNGMIGLDTARLGPALLAARQGRYTEALAMLPPEDDQQDPLVAVVRGDLLRRLGDEDGALRVLSSRAVDDANPVGWAWEWLQPPPTTHINIGGSLDLGYLDGCYLGEGDSTITPPANFRWCSDGARLRFPGAGTGRPQTLTLRVDGRAWRGYAAEPPIVHILLGEREVGVLQPSPLQVEEHTITLSASAPGSDLVITLHSATFVPDAARYNSQQGRTVVGQVQRLGIRLDWAELRAGTP